MSVHNLCALKAEQSREYSGRPPAQQTAFHHRVRDRRAVGGKVPQSIPITDIGGHNIAAGVTIEHQKHPPGKPSRQGFCSNEALPSLLLLAKYSSPHL
jgi:hypothetical protein